MTTSYQYSNIQVGDEALDPSSSAEQTTRTRRSYGRITVVLSAVALVALGLFALDANRSPSSSNVELVVNDGDITDIPILGSSLETARSCTFDECFEASCDFESAPFICLIHNGGPHMGCSPVTWTSDTCDDSCNLSDCDDMEIPPDTDMCEGLDCGSEWCAGGQVCPTAAPYQCQDGSARFGCSSDPFHWTLRTNGAECSKCCDASLC
ncbi:hypothetical protein ACA910_022250 [Epithemia clementina (nom. ined.)]